MFDDHTNGIIAEISSSHEAKTQIDEKLIDNYILTLDTETTQQTSYFQTIIPLINQTLLDSQYAEIDPTGILLKLLEKILSFINFEEVLQFYPPEFIIQNLFTSSTISILCLKILTLNLHQSQAQEFISSNKIIPQLLRVFFEENTPISVLNSIEALVSAFNSREVHLLKDGEETLYLVRKSDNAVLLARLLDLVSILVEKEDVDAKLYNFDLEEIVKFGDDPLFSILLIQFYVNMVGVCLIDGSIANVLTLYKKGDLDDLVVPEVADLISKMSYNNYDSVLATFEVFKSYNFIKIYEKNEVEIRLLSNSNPNVVYKLNPSIYDDVLKNLPLFDREFLPILLNFVASFQVWTLLQPKVTNERLESLSRDKLFLLLLAMSKYTHTKEYLFNNLPNIMNNEVIESDIRNTDIWKLKLEILENLKQSDDIPGYHYWQSKIEQSYNLMKFGQSYKHVQPKVEVIDDAL
ncbi:HSM3 [Candida theae]|uniref:DNA mismatch repair protein HSM3 n=1 Tax=Candida theae TaxID=1198502 RepID=A0AAD5G0G3_9ASCO|nr:HSM3 [Candida theae]KAI5965069.1 HSM3 [Candida theae]